MGEEVGRERAPAHLGPWKAIAFGAGLTLLATWAISLIGFVITGDDQMVGALPPEGEGIEGADDPSSPTCTASVNLKSFEVLNDTEVGQEEWKITVDATPGGKTDYALNLDVGEGELVIDEVITSEVIPNSTPIPISGLFSLRIEELDPAVGESGAVILPDYRLSCPDSRRLPLVLEGIGVDLWLEDFMVVAVFEWTVVEN